MQFYTNQNFGTAGILKRKQEREAVADLFLQSEFFDIAVFSGHAMKSSNVFS